MKPFTKQEIKAILVIMLAIVAVSFFNFRLALRRSRDSQRRSDINYVTNTLQEFIDEAGYLPLSTDDGRILACKPDNYVQLKNSLEEKEISMSEYLEALSPCNWGQDSLSDLLTDKVYIKSLPVDPRNTDGFDYLFISNEYHFQIYGYLEGGTDEEGYRDEIVQRSLSCGNYVCNYGRALGKTPLDKSLEEYENELREK